MRPRWIIVSCLFVIFVGHSSFAQGPLAPSGAPAPTMKTLDQVEPRTPISSLPFTINQPGSYYVTTNLTGADSEHGITIGASGVTLDLMGFELAGVPGSMDGIHVTAPGGTGGPCVNIVVRDGTVRDWGLGGINAEQASKSRFEQLRVLNNGSHGLSTGDDNVIAGCIAGGNGNHGISAGHGSALTDCTAHDNSWHGVAVGDDALISRCIARSNAINGYNVGNRGRISDSAASLNSNRGIHADSDNAIAGNITSTNGLDGIRVGNGCVVTDNHSAYNGTSGPDTGAGILASFFGNHIDGNYVAGNDWGIRDVASRNFLTRNRAKDNTVNYEMSFGSSAGEFIDMSISGGIIPSNTSAWANFEF